VRKIIDRLTALIDKHKKDPFLSATQLDVSNDFADRSWYWMKVFYKKKKSLKASERQFKPFWGRVVARAKQMSLLIDQCDSMEVLDHYINLETKGTQVFIKKYLHLGADNENERLAKLLEAKIKEAGRKGITAKKTR